MFIVLEKAAKMPQKCWTGKGRYRKIAVLEIEDGTTPKMISRRAKGVKNIFKVWDRCYQTPANGPNCSANRAREEAEKLCEFLNRGWYEVR